MDATALARLALALGARVTALLALTALALFLLRRANAATRHLIAVAGLAGALVLPLMSGALPELQLPILPPAKHVVVEQDFAPQATAPEIAAAAPFMEDVAQRPHFLERARRVLQLAVAAWAAGAWAAIAALLLLRLGAGMLRFSRLAQSATEDVGSLDEAARCSASLRLRRWVRLLRSSQVQVPMTAGVVEPVVILPASSTEWTKERRRLVLLHELAHVKRLDWLSLLVSEVSAAVWWFHPLAWVALRSARLDAEKATDDLVVRAGERPSVYARHLVEIARSLRSPLAVAAMPMARGSGLEDRLRALLDERGRGPSSVAGRALAGVLVAAAVLFAVVRPIAAAVPLQVAASAEAPARAVQIAAPQVKVRPLKVRLAEIGRKLAAAGQKVRSIVTAHTSGEWYSRGMDLHRQGNYERAIEAFQKAIDAGQREGAASYNIACGYARLGDSDRAFEWLNKALDAGFDVGHMLDGDDDLESLRGDPRLAGLRRISRKLAARFDHMVENPPKSADPWYSIGKELLRAEDYDRSAHAFRESAARSPKPGNSLYNTACALARKGDTGGALDFLAKAIESGFDDAGLIARDDDLDSIRGEPRFRELQERAEGGRAQYSLGLAHLQNEDFEVAARAFSRAVELDYRRAASLYNLACVESRRGDMERAFDYLDRAIDAGFDAARQIRSDDDLDNLRGDPRHAQAIRKADAKAREKIGL